MSKGKNIRVLLLCQSICRHDGNEKIVKRQQWIDHSDVKTIRTFHKVCIEYKPLLNPHSILCFWDRVFCFFVMMFDTSMWWRILCFLHFEKFMKAVFASVALYGVVLGTRCPWHSEVVGRKSEHLLWSNRNSMQVKVILHNRYTNNTIMYQQILINHYEVVASTWLALYQLRTRLRTASRNCLEMTIMAKNSTLFVMHNYISAERNILPSHLVKLGKMYTKL